MLLIARNLFQTTRNKNSLQFIKRNYEKYDVIVIGGGIVGTSIARALKNGNNQRKVALFEKENELAKHQTSHNSGVIHSGIYYKPKSLKAELCVRGMNLMYDYCSSKNIPIKKCGKLIIAKDRLEVHRLKILYNRAVENNISDLEIISDWNKVAEIQPFCSGLQALWSPKTANVDFAAITQELAKDFTELNGKIHFNAEVVNVKESIYPDYPILVETKNKLVYKCKYAVLCTGLHSGKLLKQENNLKQLSFRVNYGLLNPHLNKFIKTNIYAMPEVGLPFLGVHFSPKLDGSVLIIISALPACKLEGYKKNDLDIDYIRSIINYQGFHLMTMKNLQVGFNQITRTFSKDTQSHELKKYMPMLSKYDICEGPAAIQTQLINAEGEFFDDFLIDIFNGAGGIGKRVVNCRFVPSPGATSSLAIAELVAKKVDEVFCE